MTATGKKVTSDSFKSDPALESFITNLANVLYSSRTVSAKELHGTGLHGDIINHVENYLLLTRKTRSRVKARAAAIAFLDGLLESGDLVVTVDTSRSSLNRLGFFEQELAGEHFSVHIALMCCLIYLIRDEEGAVTIKEFQLLTASSEEVLSACLNLLEKSGCTGNENGIWSLKDRKFAVEMLAYLKSFMDGQRDTGSDGESRDGGPEP